MSQYYYFVATLPLLAFDEEKAASPQEFLEACRSHLEPDDFALLERAVLAPSGEPTEVGLDFVPLLDGERVLAAWLNWESRLRSELARLRAQRLEVEAGRYLAESGYVVGLQEIAREAMSAASPLAAEELLDRARWRFLDELEAGHSFDVARLVVYSLRLQLLERRSLLRKELGEKRFGELYAAIMPESFSRRFGQTEVERGT